MVAPGDVVRWADHRGTFRVLAVFTDAGGPTAQLVAGDGKIRFARMSGLRPARGRRPKAPRRLPTENR